MDKCSRPDEAVLMLFCLFIMLKTKKLRIIDLQDSFLFCIFNLHPKHMLYGSFTGNRHDTDFETHRRSI